MFQMTKASCIGSDTTTGYQLKSRASKIVLLLSLLICVSIIQSTLIERKPLQTNLNFWKIVFICSLFQLSIQSSTANQRYGRSRETYTRSARSVNVPRETYTRSARTLIEPYSRETYTRSARSINEPYSAHQSNFLFKVNVLSVL